MKTTRRSAQPRSLDVARIRRDFPQLARKVHGDKPLVYLDNAATTQKPQSMLDALERYYTSECSNVHRGLHELSVKATADYEGAREKARDFIGAADSSEIIFVRGTTEAINLVAHSYGGRHVGEGDEILITGMEHHSNIVPWQLLAERTGASIRVVPVADDGSLIMDEYSRLLSPRTRIVAVVHISNVLGTCNPVEEMIALAHERGVPVLLDGAQAPAHQAVDVQAMDCDFYAFSSHKMFGPTGIGVLYGKRELLEAMPPFQGGGDMIKTVSFEQTTFNDLPFKFEAGTPNIAGAIGFGAAIDYVREAGVDLIAAREAQLLDYASRALAEIPGLRIIGTAPRKVGVISFAIDRIHPHDIATVLDLEGVAIRAGHHCSQPLMERFGVPATARASLALYNTERDVDTLVAGLHKVLEVFS
jgi:cysteine desulfurase/selenocysteine lyase